jgi:hypothetical protein
MIMIGNIVTGIIEISDLLNFDSFVIFVISCSFHKSVHLQIRAENIHSGFLVESALFSHRRSLRPLLMVNFQFWRPIILFNLIFYL